MDIFDLKTAGVTAPVPDTALLFGADSDTATQPSLYPRSRFAQLTAGGNLGVGTASPAARIESYDISNGAALELLRLSNAGTGSNTKALLGFSAASTQYAQILGGYGASSPEMNFKLPTASAGKFTWQPSSGAGVTMTLDTTGLGIGTGSPVSKLHVVGAAASLRIGYNGTGVNYYDADSHYLRDSAGTSLLSIQRASGNVSIQAAGTGAYVYLNSTSSGNSLITGLDNGAGRWGVGQLGWGGADGLAFYLGGSFTEVARFNASGNLGIGTASPQYRLDVAGGHARVRSANSLFWFNSTDENYVGIYNAGAAGLGNGALAFGINGAEAGRFNASGNLGLAVTAPGARLHMGGAAPELRLDSSTAGDTGWLSFHESATRRGWIQVTGNTFRFNSDSAYPFVFTGGSMGIGTASPNDKLDVAGNVRLSFSGYLHAGGFGRLYLPANLQIGSGVAYAGLYAPTLTYNAKIVNGAWKSIGGGVASAITMDEGLFALWASASVGAGDVALSWTPRLAVDSSGNVGVGTSSPSGRLHAEYANDAWSAKFGAPSGKLRMSGYIAGYAGAAVEGVNAAENAYAPLWLNGSQVRIGSAGADRMLIRSDGDIGIGTMGSIYAAGSRRSVSINGPSESMLAMTIGDSPASYLWANASHTQLMESRNAGLTLGTNGTIRIAIDGAGGIDFVSLAATAAAAVASTHKIAVKINGATYYLLASNV